ncbi:hypothetical protein MKW94_007782 [Papaver nudicaule]|uniref:Non-structural maintenance of chromosomes element 4 n=1 Tax=Papaver nudicaule TaxID=74823 RepID=A0AA41VFR7_PAPNU|nr:hypothetical protein [Papaver nudicaule]
MVIVKEESALQVSSRDDVFWSHYHALHNLIQEESENIGLSDKFGHILVKLERLNELASTPRHQVIDAQVLSDFVNKLSLSIKSFNNKIIPTDFITCLLQKYGAYNICCSTMNFEANKYKIVYKKRTRSVMEVEYPEDLNNNTIVENIETDQNVSTIFDALKTRKKSEKVEHAIMNRNSFAQTAENLFSLSFFVSMGRAEIKVDGDGHHVVSLRNAPYSKSTKSGEIKCKQFVFRVDYKDWNSMKDLVAIGDEVMPHRNSAIIEVMKDIVVVKEETCVGNSKSLEGDYQGQPMSKEQNMDELSNFRSFRRPLPGSKKSEAKNMLGGIVDTYHPLRPAKDLGPRNEELGRGKRARIPKKK